MGAYLKTRSDEEIQAFVEAHPRREVVPREPGSDADRNDRLMEIVNSRFPEVVKIILTAHTNLDSALYTINNANVDKYISKPWRIEDLQLTLASLLNQFQLKRDNERLIGELQRRNLELNSSLRDLKSAKDHGAISEEEYQREKEELVQAAQR